MISVVGGCYAELCLVPTWNHIYGSAGRAAAAISSRCPVELYTLLSVEFEADFLLLMSAYDDVSHRSVEQSCSVSFEYLHPLASPYMLISGERPLSGTLKPVRGENILCFGMVEYVPTVHGTDKVVYDPQGDKPLLFSATGSTARELVYVLNEQELTKITRIDDLTEAGNFLLNRERNTSAVVLKRGPAGVTIFKPDGIKTVPCYRARRVFKIGSGDVFAAAFAYFWMEGLETIENAADLASRATACYVETQDAYIPTKDELLRDYDQPILSGPGSVYLASPFFSLEQRWLVEETKLLLEHFGCQVFSPLHEVGTGQSSEVIATEDLIGLQNCGTILALINDNDTGTIFEVGYGKALNKRIVAYAERNNARDLTMLEGTTCHVFPDYCSAIYNAVWESAVS